MTGTVQPTFSNTNGDQQGVSAATPFPVTSSGTGTGADQVQGNTAAGAADSGNPVKVGGVYNSSAVTLTTGQRGDLQLGVNGQVVSSVGTTQNNGDALSNVALNFFDKTSTTAAPASVYPRVYNGSTWDRTRGDTNGTNMQLAATASRWQYAAVSGGIVNTTTAVTLAAAAGASIRNYLSSLEISADTLGAATEIAIRDGAAGTVLWRAKIQTTGLPLTLITFPVPLKGTANTLLEFVTLTASVTGAVYVNAQGFTGA